jgi:hypothetical protein
MLPNASDNIRNRSRRRAEVMNAIADLAVSARAGTISRAYQREWFWQDKQNFIDSVDADEFNEAFHGIEREFDKLSQGSGLNIAPDWEQEITLAEGSQYVTLSHDLGTTNLLVDLQAKIVVPEGERGAVFAAGLGGPIAPGTELWTNYGNGALYIYGLLDDNTILLLQDAGRKEGIFGGDLTLRVRLWKLGE